MSEYRGRVKGGVIILDGPVVPPEGRRVKVEELPVDDADKAFWIEKSLEELAAEQGVPVVTGINHLAGGWPADELDDGFEEEVRRWRAGSGDTRS